MRLSVPCVRVRIFIHVCLEVATWLAIPQPTTKAQKVADAADRIAWKQRLLDNRLLQTFTTEGVYHYSVAIGWRRKRCKDQKSLIGGTKDSSEIQAGKIPPPGIIKDAG